MDENIEKFKCNRCQGERKHFVRAEHAFCVEITDVVNSWIDVRYLVVECCGCENFSFLKMVANSLDAEPFEILPDGRSNCRPVWNVETYPSINARALPDWVNKLDDEILEAVLLEVHRSLQSDSTFLAAFGCRTLLERFVYLYSGERVNYLSKRLEELKEEKIISKEEFSQLELVNKAGDASAHRAWNPEKGDLGTILDIIEGMIHRYIILASDAEKIKPKIPGRPK